MVTVITELRCIVGAFKGRILHQRFTSGFYMGSYSPTRSGRHMFGSAKDCASFFIKTKEAPYAI